MVGTKAVWNQVPREIVRWKKGGISREKYKHIPNWWNQVLKIIVGPSPNLS